MNRFPHFRAFVSLVGATALLMACSSGGGGGGGGCPAEAPVTCFNPQGAATGCCATSCDPNGVCLNATGGSGGVAGAFGGTAGSSAGSAGSGGASGAAGTGGVAGSGGTTASGGVGGTTGGTGGAGGTTGGTGGVGGTTGGTGGVGGTTGGTGGVGGSTGGTGGVGGSTGGTGGACVDANEPNDSETGATNLGTLNDCDSSGGTLDATLSGSADSDFYEFIGTDSFCIVDPTASTSAAVRLCMFASCPGGTVFCVSGSSATSPGGSQGCCTGNAGGNVQLQIFCNNAPADVTMRVDQGGSACKSYDLSYHC